MSTLTMPADPLAHIDPDAVGKLSNRRRFICALMARGVANKNIAALLDIGLRSVELAQQQAASVLGIPTGYLALWAARNIDKLPSELPAGLEPRPVIGPAPRKELKSDFSSPVQKPRRDPTAPRDCDPTPEEIAERAAAIRVKWEMGEPSYDEEDIAPSRGLEVQPCCA